MSRSFRKNSYDEAEKVSRQANGRARYREDSFGNMIIESRSEKLLKKLRKRELKQQTIQPITNQFTLGE